MAFSRDEIKDWHRDCCDDDKQTFGWYSGGFSNSYTPAYRCFSKDHIEKNLKSLDKLGANVNVISAWDITRYWFMGYVDGLIEQGNYEDAEDVRNYLLARGIDVRGM